MEEKILFVDDDVKALLGYERVLHREFQVTTATGGAEGLATLQANGPYAIVISDMRMPAMNGADFLAQVRQRSPSTVRMLLTGYADLDAAIEAVNAGNIFRYLTKPCRKDDLVHAIESGLEYYRSILTDKGLIKKALLTGRAESAWDALSHPAPDDFESSTGLPGPFQARSDLASICGTDSQSYSVFLRLTLLRPVEDRYGIEAAKDYLNKETHFLRNMLQPQDRLYHWGRDLLLVIMKRPAPLAGVRKEISDLVLCLHEQIIEVNGRGAMIASTIEFDVLPVGVFSTWEGLLAGFVAKARKDA